MKLNNNTNYTNLFNILRNNYDSNLANFNNKNVRKQAILDGKLSYKGGDSFVRSTKSTKTKNDDNLYTWNKSKTDFIDCEEIRTEFPWIN